MRPPYTWTPLVNSSLNLKGDDTGIVLKCHNDLLLEQSLIFEFKANNNQFKYDTFIAGMSLDKEMGVSSLRARNDS